MESSQSKTLGIVAVVSMAHVAALMALSAKEAVKPQPTLPAPVMMVSLVAPPPIPQQPVEPQPLPKPTSASRPEAKPKPKPELKPRPNPVLEPPPPGPLPEPVNDVPKPAVMPASQPPVTLPPRVDASGHDNQPPAYPALSQRLREEGEVTLKIRILRNGSVTAVRIQQSSGYPRLDQAAVEAVKHWRYVPATVGGEAIEYDYLQPIEFRL